MHAHTLKGMKVKIVTKIV